MITAKRKIVREERRRERERGTLFVRMIIHFFFFQRFALRSSRENRKSHAAADDDNAKNLSTFFGVGGGDNLRTFRRAVSLRRMAGWSRTTESEREREREREKEKYGERQERERERGPTFHKIACRLSLSLSLSFVVLSSFWNRPFIYDNGTAQFESVHPFFLIVTS